jgi:phospholipid/cholesterol/gamma-HCH transport system substrate-binding protein
VGRNPRVARNLHMGDYTNLSVNLDIALPEAGGGGGPKPPVPTNPVKVCTKLKDLPDNTPIGQLPENLCKAAAKKINRCIKHPSPKNCQGVPKAIVKRVAKSICQSQPNNPICDVLPGPLGGSGGGGGGGGGGGVPVPPIPGLPRRVGYGPTDSASVRGPTMGELSRVYDPDLVALLVPGMVTR